MKFGTKNKDVPVYSGSDYIRTLKKGETTLRFLQECDDWVMYREHYSLEGRAFPCTQDRNTCPGCTHEKEKVSRSSRKYAVNVLLKPQGIHMVVKLPITVVNRFEARSERNGGTLTDRDYVIIKSGEGLDTEYDVETGDKYEENYKEKLFDIEEMLADMYEYGTQQSTTDQTPSHDPEDPPSEPQVQSASADTEDEVVINEYQLRKMTMGELLDIAKSERLVVPGEIESKSDLADFIMDSLAS